MRRAGKPQAGERKDGWWCRPCRWLVFFPGVLVLVGSCPWSAMAQDIDKLAASLKKPSLRTLLKGKSVSVKGTLMANYNHYQVNGLENRQSPSNYLLSGNLVINFFDKVRMPISFSYVNRGASFVNPLASPVPLPFGQPFNRLVFKPRYKGLALQVGTAVLSFSPFTLAGHRFQGLGVTYKGKRFPVYGGLMLGRLNTLVQPDTVRFNRPGYQRNGFGLQLGYRHERDYIEAILFTARDQYGPGALSLDRYSLYPAANAVTSLRGGKQLTKQIYWEADVAVSGLTRDVRTAAATEASTVWRTVGGLLPVNASTYYRKAVSTSLNYQAQQYLLGLDYKRVDPQYQTLGGYYFINDLESISLRASTHLWHNKVALTGEFGRQSDNLDGSNPQTLRRLVSGLTLVYAPSERLNVNLAYSGFASVSNYNPALLYLAKAQPLEALDTLNYRQINQNAQANVLIGLPSADAALKRTLLASLVVQGGNEQVGGSGGHNSLLNGTLLYAQTAGPKQLSWSGGINLTQLVNPVLHSLIWGPVLTVGTSLPGDKLKAFATLNLVRSDTRVAGGGEQAFSLLTARLGTTWAITPAQSLQLNAGWIQKQTPGSAVYSANFSELTLGVQYRCALTLLNMTVK